MGTKYNPGMTTTNPGYDFLMLAAVLLLLLTIACGQDPAPSPIIIVATPTPAASNSPLPTGDQPSGAQPAEKQPGAQPTEKQPGTQPRDSELKDWTPQQHTAVDKAIEEAYGVFAKDLDECISELGEPDGDPFEDDLARYEAAITQSPYLECIRRKLTQN